MKIQFYSTFNKVRFHFQRPIKSRRKKGNVCKRTIQRKRNKLRKPRLNFKNVDSSSSGTEIQPRKTSQASKNPNQVYMSTDVSCLDSSSLSSHEEFPIEVNSDKSPIEMDTSFDEVDQEQRIAAGEINALETDSALPNIAEEVNASSSVTNENSGLYTLFSGKNFKEDVKKWAILTRTPHSKISPLLVMLRLYNLDVPLDPRSLLRTPRNTEIKKCQYGEYMHFGLPESLQNILKKNAHIGIPGNLNLGIGIDDVPTYKGVSITLILGCLDEINEVFIIGIYKADKLEDKQKEDPDAYLKDFVEDMSMLEVFGLDCDQQKYNIEFSKLVADAVAKSKVLKQTGHTGYLSCTKCWVYGAFKNRRIFYKETNCLRKRDAEQKASSTSILKNVTGFQFVTKVPLDYMHLVCLGVVRTILTLLTSGKNLGLGSAVIKRISNRLQIFREYTPAEFVRKPDSLSFLGNWKATQLRQFLLYVGYAAMIDIIPSNILQMFSKLSIAIRILCTTKENLYNIAHTLLIEFLNEFEDIFGEEYLSHNFHGLSHIRDDVRLHGPLDKFSAFKYENFMQSVLQDIRKPDKIIQQIFKRQKEREVTPLDRIKKTFKPVLNRSVTVVEGLSGIQYSKIKYKQFVINTKSNGDNCFLIGNKVVIIENIIFKNDNYFMVTRKFKDVVDLPNQPIDSSILNMYMCSNLSNTSRIHEISELTSKLFRLPLKNDAFMVSPLIHFEVYDEH